MLTQGAQSYVREYVPSRSFADIGCMWGVNGEYSFVAEEAGATLVKAVDVFGPTPEFRGEEGRAWIVCRVHPRRRDEP